MTTGCLTSPFMLQPPYRHSAVMSVLLLLIGAIVTYRYISLLYTLCSEKNTHLRFQL